MESLSKKVTEQDVKKLKKGKDSSFPVYFVNNDTVLF
jgi:hypothetical protein